MKLIGGFVGSCRGQPCFYSKLPRAGSARTVQGGVLGRLGGLGRGISWGNLGCPGKRFGPSWAWGLGAAPGPGGVLGRLGAVLGELWAILGRGSLFRPGALGVLGALPLSPT